MAGNTPFHSADSQLKVPAGDPGPAEAPRSSMSPHWVRTLGLFLYQADLLLPQKPNLLVTLPTIKSFGRENPLLFNTMVFTMF